MPGTAHLSQSAPRIDDRPELIRRALRRFILLAVPVLLVVGFGLKLTFDRYQAGRFDVVASREEGYLRAVEVVIQQELDEVLADVDTLAAALSLHPWRTDPAALAALPRLFVTYGQENDRYDQIRLLDLNGDERLRVNFRNGQAQVVPAEGLQNKANRPYFRAMVGLGRGERYVSPLELNMEHGEIELPLNPTIRFGARVFAPDGAEAGVLVLNYRAEKMESRLRSFARVGDPVDTLLVNGRGELILDGAAGMADWLLKATTSDVRLVSWRPAWWNAASHGGDFGRLMTDEGLLISHGIRPLAATKTHHENPLIASEQTFEWTAMRFVPADALHENAFVASWPGRVAMVAIFGAIAALIFAASLLMEREILGRRRQLETIEGSEAELGALIDAAPSGILEVNAAGRIVRVNRELSRMLGYRQDELIGQSVELLLPEHARDQHPDLRQQYFEHPVPRKMAEMTPERNLVARHKSGRLIPVSINLNMFSSGRNSHAIATIIDVTRQRAFEADLQAARDHAQEASAAKSAFLAMMSHEIRTPLNAIVGMSYLLGRGELNDGQRDDVQAIESSGKALLALISDVLDFSRIEAGELLVESRNFRLPELMRDLEAMFRALAAGKGIALQIDPVPADVPALLRLDPGRLHQILVNLVGNAIKFTDAGRVQVGVARIDGPQGDPRVHLRFTVSDTGIGIAPDRQARLFDAFVQADSSTSRKYGGSGLGLSIVKRLAEMMSGQVGFESAPGKGARFWVELPFEVPSPDALVLRDGMAGAEVVRVVVVGAEASLLALCADFAWEAQAVGDGDDPGTRVCALALGARVDCVLVGEPAPANTAADVVDALDRAGLKVPVVAIAGPGEVPCARLGPPINASALFNAVNEAIVAGGGDLGHLSYDSTLPADSLALVGIHVLAVDDSELNLQVVERLLALQGARVSTCSSGQVALLRIREADAPFDAILMDLQMPGMDGFDATQQIREALGGQCPPIMALTAGVTRAEADRARAVGMCDYLTKPVDPQVLIRVIRRHVERFRGRTVALADPRDETHTDGAPVVAPAAAAGTGAWPDIAGIDGALSSALMLGDTAFFATVLGTFMRHTDDVAAPLRDAMRAGDLERARRLVHKLRGQAGNIGATVLQGIAGRVETGLNERDPSTGSVDELIDTLDTLRQAIDAWLTTRAVTPVGEEQT